MNTKKQLSLLPLVLVAMFGYANSEAAALSGKLTVSGQVVEGPCKLQSNAQSINTSCWVNYKTLNDQIDTQALRTSKQPYYLDEKGLSIAYKEQRASTHLYQVNYQ